MVKKLSNLLLSHKLRKTGGVFKGQSPLGGGGVEATKCRPGGGPAPSSPESKA